MAILKVEKLQEFLTAMATSVAEGDSFEGRISYSRMTPGLERGEVEVSVAVRVGNRDGQGGMTMLEASPINDQGCIIGREDVVNHQHEEMIRAMNNSPMGTKES